MSVSKVSVTSNVTQKEYKILWSNIYIIIFIFVQLLILLMENIF